VNLPSTNTDSAFERFLQELPQEYGDLAIEFKAFTRPRKIKTPAQLLQVVRCYCGLDQARRETAGNVTLVEARISDTAIHKRLPACLPWVKARLARMLGTGSGALDPRQSALCGGGRLDGARPRSQWDLVSVAQCGGLGEVAPDSG